MSHALQEHRRRQSERGMKRVEVCVREPDADLIRKVAKVLVNDEKTAGGLRMAIEKVMPSRSALSFKEWLLASGGDDDSPRAQQPDSSRGF